VLLLYLANTYIFAFGRLALVLLGGAVWCLPLKLYAQQSGDVMPTIDVFGDRPVETGEVQHEEFSGSFKRIEREELQRRDIDLAQIISHESGVQSLQVGGFGTFSSITVRAATAAQTGVYLDGIQLNSAGNSVVDLSLLDLLTAESLDIYRGATPLQLGAGTIGGAINIRSPVVGTGVSAGTSSTRALVGLGSFNMQQAQALHRGRYAGWDVIGGFSLQQSDNDYPFLDSNGTPLNVNDDTRQDRNNAAVQRFSTIAKAGTDWSNDSRTDLLLQATIRETGVPEFRNSADNVAGFDTQNLQLQLNHRLDGLGRTGNWNSRLGIFQHIDNDEFDDSLSQIGLSPQRTSVANQTTGFTGYLEYLGDLATVGLSAELRFEEQEDKNLLSDAFDFRADRTAINVAAQSLFYFSDDRLLVIPSLRFQSVDDSFDLVTRAGGDQRGDSNLSPALGLRYNRSDRWTYRFNVGSFFREPSFDELFGNRGLFQGNEDLVAEEGINADIGLKWTPAENTEIDVSLFGSWRDELIATIFNAQGIGTSTNIAEARILGVEFSASWQPTPAISVLANVTLQDAQSLQRFQAFDGRQLPGEARQATYFRLQHSSRFIKLFVEAEGLRNRFYDQANVLPATDSWLQNIGFDWRYANWSVRGVVNNLGDQNVEDFNGFPRPGRSFSLAVSTNFK